MFAHLIIFSEERIVWCSWKTGRSNHFAGVAPAMYLRIGIVIQFHFLFLTRSSIRPKAAKHRAKRFHSDIFLC